MEKNTLYIPVNIRREKEIVDGFGKNELVKTAITILIGVVFGIIFSAFKSQSFFLMISPFFAGMIGIALFKKNVITNKSFVDFFIDYVRFIKSKKSYSYKYNNIYERMENK